MRKPFRLLAAVLVCCMVAGMLPPVSSAAGGTVHTPTEAELGDFISYINRDTIKDGDTIQITGSAYVGTKTDAPWVIHKELTFEGGTLVLWAGGIVLGKNVTFKNTDIDFTMVTRNAIAANGHTLTLNNVTSSNLGFNLFCGGMINSNNENLGLPDTTGTSGKIVIQIGRAHV